MEQSTPSFTLDTLLRKKIDKLRRQERDARLHNRLSALLWLAEGHSPEHIAHLLGVCPRTVRNWLDLYRHAGLDGLRSLEYKGDPG